MGWEEGECGVTAKVVFNFVFVLKLDSGDGPLTLRMQ